MKYTYVFKNSLFYCILSVIICFFISGCGYRPVAQITQNTLGNSVYIRVTIDKTEPKNSVYITDAVREGIVSRLGTSISEDSNSKSKIDISIQSISYKAITYDEYGYITAYKVSLRLLFRTKFENGKVSDMVTSGEHDFSIARKLKDTRFADSVIGEHERFEAIKKASSEAFDEYISLLAISGIKGN